MQPDRFTLKSQEAVAAAQRLAAEARNTEVAPQHLLLALLEQEDGNGVLSGLGVDKATTETQVTAMIAAITITKG